MHTAIVRKHEGRRRRALRVRKKLRGTAECPRLCVTKSNRHLSVQLIDDEKGTTLASAGSSSKDLQGTESGRKGKQAAKTIGESIAEKAKTLGVSRVIFDRGSAKYHGVLAELANAAREAGLEF